MIRKKPLFGSACLDEVDLFERAQSLQPDFSVLSESKLREQTQAQGVALASVALYQKICTEFYGFIEELNQQAAEQFTVRQPVKVLIVPGMFYQQFPEIGADGQFIASILKRCGFEVDTVPTKSLGSIQDNALLIEKRIVEDESQNVWIVSLSRGASEVRLALQNLAGERVLTKIKGWLSLSGILSGAYLVDEILNRPMKKTLYRLYCRLIRADFRGLEELHTQHPFWSQAFPENSHIEIIHVTPMALLPHLHPKLVERYHLLAAYGPNDGTVNIWSAYDFPGKIYPVWGCDHFLRSSKISALIYKLGRYINSKSTCEEIQG